MNIKKRIILIAIIFIQVIYLFLVFSRFKQGFHSDEVWNYAFANSYETKEITNSLDGESYLNQWMSSDFLKNYITVDENHRFSYSTVIRNAAIDLNPPLQYLILHTICSFFPGKFSWYFCFAINIISFIVTQIYLFQTMESITSNKSWVSFASILLYGFGMGATNIALFLRIYALGVMFVIMFAYYSQEFFQLRKEKKLPVKVIILLFVTTFLGAYTLHLFLLVAFCITLCFTLFYVFTKRIKTMLTYGLTILSSAILSLVVFPTTFSHVGGAVESHTYGMVRYPFKMQLRMYAYMLTKDLFGIRICPFPNPYLEWFIIGLVVCIVIVTPFLVVFRNETWLHKAKEFLIHKAKSIYEKKSNIQFSLVAYLITILSVLVVASVRTSLYSMGVYASRYIFVLYPLAVLFVVGTVYYLLILLTEKRKITYGIVLFCSLGMALWTHLCPFHRDYFFEKTTEGKTLAQLEENANSVIILSQNWLLVCFAPEMYHTKSYYATNFSDFQKNPEEMNDFNVEEPYYLIVDDSHIMSDDVLREVVESDPMFKNWADTVFYEQELLNIYRNNVGIKDLIYVGSDQLMGRNFRIYQFVF